MGCLQSQSRTIIIWQPSLCESVDSEWPPSTADSTAESTTKSTAESAAVSSLLSVLSCVENENSAPPSGKLYVLMDNLRNSE